MLGVYGKRIKDQVFVTLPGSSQEKNIIYLQTELGKNYSALGSLRTEPARQDENQLCHCTFKAGERLIFPLITVPEPERGRKDRST